MLGRVREETHDPGRHVDTMRRVTRAVRKAIAEGSARLDDRYQDRSRGPADEMQGEGSTREASTNDCNARQLAVCQLGQRYRMDVAPHHEPLVPIRCRMSA